MKHVYVMVDVETDGPCPGLYSMVRLGAVVVEPELQRRFSCDLGALTNWWDEDALAVSGLTREQTELFPPPEQEIPKFFDWLMTEHDPEKERLVFVSDNNGFDWQFVNYYFHRFMGKNPFGHSSMNLGSLYKGLVRDVTKSFKHLRKTKHTHDPLDDALGNAEAMLEMKNMGLVVP